MIESDFVKSVPAKKRKYELAILLRNMYQLVQRSCFILAFYLRLEDVLLEVLNMLK